MTKSLSLLWCKHSLMLSNLFLSPSAEILSSGLSLHIYLTILALFVSCLITSFSLFGQVSHPYNITLRTFVECNLPFAPNGKFLLATKGTKSLDLLYPLLILLITPSAASPVAHIVSPR